MLSCLTLEDSVLFRYTTGTSTPDHDDNHSDNDDANDDNEGDDCRLEGSTTGTISTCLKRLARLTTGATWSM